MLVFLVSRYIKYILRVTVMTPVNYVRSPAVAKAYSKALKSCQCLGGNEGISDRRKVLDRRFKNFETSERILHHRSSGEGIRSAFWTFPPCCHGRIRLLSSSKGKTRAILPVIIPQLRTLSLTPASPFVAPMAASAVSTKLLESASEPFDGSSTKAEAFWTNLDNYYYLNTNAFASKNKKIATTLTHFKLGTAAGDWAHNC